MTTSQQYPKWIYPTGGPADSYPQGMEPYIIYSAADEPKPVDEFKEVEAKEPVKRGRPSKAT